MIYWVIIWREGDDWGWLSSLDGNDWCTTQEAAERRRYRTHEKAMAALWRFRANNPKRPNERLRIARVSVKRPVTATEGTVQP